MCYNHGMRETKQYTAVDAKVVMSLRLPLLYRNQLAEMASESRVSLNQLVLDALEKEYPPNVANSGD